MKKNQNLKFAEKIISQGYTFFIQFIFNFSFEHFLLAKFACDIWKNI